MRRFPLIFALWAMLLSGCASMKVGDFSKVEPIFEPLKFFAGRTISSGVVETRGGAPMERVRTKTWGRWEEGILRLEQDLFFGDEKPRHRSWRIRRLDQHHYEATANDMIGTAAGEAFGNAFHWSFTLALSPGNPLANVKMTQWMYLQPDGRTLLNHSTIRKFGLVVAQVTEEFRKK